MADDRFQAVLGDFLSIWPAEMRKKDKTFRIMLEELSDGRNGAYIYFESYF